jgi:hypothetical protein
MDNIDNGDSIDNEDNIDTKMRKQIIFVFWLCKTL